VRRRSRQRSASAPNTEKGRFQRSFRRQRAARDASRPRRNESEDKHGPAGILTAIGRLIFSRMLASLYGNTCTRPETSGYYWQQSRRPLTCLAFVVPLLALYEGGVLWLGAQAMRNGADVWLRQVLDLLGFGQYFLLPLLTVGILLGWHHATRQPWHFVPGVLYAMFAECLLLALVLVVIARLQGAILSMFLVPHGDWPVHASIFTGTLGVAGKLVSFFGAGIYEEVLFRLTLLPLAAWGLRLAGCSPRQTLVGAVLLTSLLFSAAHYVGPHGQTFDSSTFLFRSVAGGFFALLFVYRGFGIAAGTHAFYDIVVGLCCATV
jgi:CAAX prenyl protease-like protein